MAHQSPSIKWLQTMKETPIGDKASESPVRNIFIFGIMRAMPSKN
jgi:hypothetical protein